MQQCVRASSPIALTLLRQIRTAVGRFIVLDQSARVLGAGFMERIDALATFKNYEKKYIIGVNMPPALERTKVLSTKKRTHKINGHPDSISYIEYEESEYFQET